MLAQIPVLMKKNQRLTDDFNATNGPMEAAHARFYPDGEQAHYPIETHVQMLPFAKERFAKCLIVEEAARELRDHITKSLQLKRKIDAMTSNDNGQDMGDEMPRKPVVRRGVLMSELKQEADELPLWIGRYYEPAPPLCGAIPAAADYIAKPGDKVAARVKSTEMEDQWILAEFVSFNAVTKKYIVDDFDEEGRERHMLIKWHMVPLPLWMATAQLNPEALFKVGTCVMALYPQTTCFYRAKVEALPRVDRLSGDEHGDDYQILFEDHTYALGYAPALPIAQKYIVVTKDMTKDMRMKR